LSLLPAACAVGDEAAHGFSGYAGAVLDVLHFVARRRLPAVKRTAAMPGRVGQRKTNQLALLNCTPPGRGKSPAIEHNRALPKVGQSLRRLRLVAYRLRALRVRVMVGYVLRPSPDKGYVGVAVAALGSSGASRGRWGSLPRRWARALAGCAGGQFVVKVGAGGTAAPACIDRQSLHSPYMTRQIDKGLTD